MTGGPWQEAACSSRDTTATRRTRIDRQRTLAGLVSISPEPPLPIDLPTRKVPPPSPPQQSPPTHAPVAARLAIAAAAAAASDPSMPFGGALEAAANAVSPGNTVAGSPSLELAWRVVHAAETRKAAMLDQRTLALRVRRSLATSNGLSSTFSGQKATAPLRDTFDLSEQGQHQRALLSTTAGSATASPGVVASGLPLVQVSSFLSHEGVHAEQAARISGDSSPISPGAYDRGIACGVRRRRHASRGANRLSTLDREDDEDFAVSGIRLDATKRGAAAVGAAAASMSAAAAAAAAAMGAVSDAKAPKKAVGGAQAVTSGHQADRSEPNAADTQALAEALTAALGRLRSRTESDLPEDAGSSSEALSPVPRVLAAPAPEDLAAAACDTSGYPVVSSPSRANLPADSNAVDDHGPSSGEAPQPPLPQSPPQPPGRKAPARISDPLTAPVTAPAQGNRGSISERKGSDVKEKSVKRASVAASEEPSSPGPPGSAPTPSPATRRATTQRPQANGTGGDKAVQNPAAIRRSRSMPAAEKPEKARTAAAAAPSSSSASAGGSLPAASEGDAAASARVKPAEKAASPPSSAKGHVEQAPAAEKPLDKPAAEKAAEKVSEKVAERSTEKAAEKVPEKATEKAPERSERSSEKVAESLLRRSCRSLAKACPEKRALLPCRSRRRPLLQEQALWQRRCVRRAAFPRR
eukprot:TRINITY_DN36314_c0_g1_i2.p1 TRINITY_DN36314_c0_g1~~TRINITY_DN36314_c0_g1_i2.p1  ORF type:complete len:697 (+),score=151.83 TRINITY_DN36314_c0_g1_i2:127-2217(+)